MERKHGFSMAELLVVMSILGVFAVVAVPPMKDYIIESKVATVGSIVLTQLEEITKDYYYTGSFPSSFPFLGVTVYNYNNTSTSYIAATNPWTAGYITYRTSGNYAYLQVYFTTAYLGFPDFTGSVPGYKVFRAAAFLDSTTKVFKFICGPQLAGGDQNDIPVRYLPDNCTCTDMGNAWGGTGSCIT